MLMKYLTAVIVTACLTTNTVELASQSPAHPRVERAAMNARVTLRDNIYTYSYDVDNSAQSSASIWMVTIDVTRIGGQALPWDGLPPLDELSQSVLSSDSARPVVPVGLFAPFTWSGNLTIRGQVSWTADEDYSTIRAGGALSGMQIVSPAPPTVRQFRAEPYTAIEDTLVPPPEDEFGDMQRYAADIDRFRAIVGYSGSTLGPGKVPESLNTSTCLELLSKHLDIAVSLGWIRDVLWATSLKAKIEAACNYDVPRRQSNILGALIQEIDAQTGKALSGEAADLLKLNADFVIRHQ
jgi:hypothetical protein